MKKCTAFLCVVLALILFIIVVQPGFAENHEKIVGTWWKLVSFNAEIKETGELKPYYENSPNPRGYIILTPEGRMMAVVTGEGRKPPQTQEDRSKAMVTMLAYSGMYRFEGDKFITRVDVAWSEEWVGTEQIRFFKLEGNHLKIQSVWFPNNYFPHLGLGKTIRAILTWEPVK
jgi:hypothetical protein